MLYRKLGRTGINVGIVGLGLEHLLEKDQDTVTATIHAAIKGGVNYIDCLSHPENLSKLGNAIAGCREKLILTYLASPDASAAENERGIENYLARVGTDYADVLIIANCDKTAIFEKVTAARGALEWAKNLQSAGKVRFIGFSTHVSEIAFKVIANGSFDVLMYPINPAFDILTNEEKQVPDNLGYLWDAAYQYQASGSQSADYIRKDVFRACVKHDIGLVAMKPFAAGWLFQPALNTGFTPINLVSYALSQAGVSVAIPGCASAGEMEQVLQYFTCTEAERDFSQAVAKSKWSVQGTCLYCSHCLPCAADIDIATVNKLVDSSGDGKNLTVLKEKYNALPNKASACLQCGACEDRCPFGVAVTEKMATAVRLFE